MKVLLLGADGQVGSRLREQLGPVGELLALGRAGQDGLCGDLTQADALRDTVRRVQPDVVVNAAAYTAVDRAETETALAFAINADGPAVLAQEAQRIGAWIVHFSTDYVFDGSGSRAWTEDDVPHPLNAYGRSKLAGEQAIAAACERHLVLRTSWVFDARGANFLRTILQRAAAQDSLAVVDDEVGAPTPAAWLASVVASVLPRLSGEKAGIYHAVASGETSWNGYARYAIGCAQEAGLPLRATPDRVAGIPAGSLQRAAARPRNSRLSTHKLQSTFGLAPPPWQDGVRAAVLALAAEGTPP
jgi:dTDP-4-dehydrorhamnose reductase